MKRTGSAEYGHTLKVLLGGEPGSGKTVFASNFPNPIIAAAEPGLMSIYDRKIPFVEIERSLDLQQLRIMLDQRADVRADDMGFETQTLVVDTIDEIQRILIKERLEETRKDAMQLQDWGWLGEQMQSIIRGLRALDMHVVFTVHLKDTQDAETGAVWQDPGLQGAIAKQIPAAVDLALVLKSATVTEVDEEANSTRKRSVRLLLTQPTQRYPWVKDRSGKLPPEMEVGMFDSFDLLYNPIFGGVTEVTESEVISRPKVTLAEPEPMEPEAEPEVEVPEPELTPEPEPEPEPEPVAPEPEPVEEKKEETPATTMDTCDDCGAEVEEEWAALSKIKHRRPLCRTHYKAANAAKAKAM